VNHQRSKIKKSLESNENENTTYQNLLGYSKDSAKRKVYSFEHLYVKKIVKKYIASGIS
jgi:hypothetical protein